MPRKKVISHDRKHRDVKPPNVKGEESISGDMTTPDADDNVLDNAHEAGLYEDADEEHPKELDLGEEINKDEKDIREK
ncbi:hypothetical protein C4577_00560 [Candidatus Parcubacteria bacterium]|nr:MAG: hypothetical protein C4577_00560 [Candidatus Parcubacteria bacterium]